MKLSMQKRIKVCTALLCTATLLGGCGKATAPQETPVVSSAAPEVKAADFILKNGIIQTMVSEEDRQEAIAIIGNEIVYVGSNDDVQAYAGDTTQIIDLDGAMVTPGFMDGHIHTPGAWLSRLYEINFEGCTTNEEYLANVKEFIETHPDYKTYVGGSFMLNAYAKEDGSNPGPIKEDLDAICSDKPILLYDISHHSAWVNSKALEIAGITKDTPNPAGGVITKNDKGEPSGYLTDGAVNLVSDVLEFEETTEEMYVEAINRFQEEANSRGVTGMFSLDGERMAGYKTLADQDALNLRIRFASTVVPSMSPEEAIATIKAQESFTGELLTGGSVKLFSDGVTEGATAVMLQPYQEAAGMGSDWCGESIWSNEDFKAMVLALDKEGIQIHVHSIGDGAVQQTLDAYEEAIETNGKRDARYTMTHVCAITPEDIKRNADLGVIDALQFLWMYNDELCELEKAFIGEDRALAMYPVKDMLEQGCIISGASDCPVTDYTPLDEIEVAVTRNCPYPELEDADLTRTPSQAITPYQALEAYTKNVAYQCFLDDKVGTIEVGKKADLAVLSQDILNCEPKTISDTEVLYTFSNGRLVYQK